MQLVGRRYDTGDAVRISIEGGRVAGTTAYTPAGEQIESLPWIGPSLMDLQINGYEGQEFCAAELTPEKVERVIRAYDRLGVTQSCPTVTTQSPEVMHHALATIAAACEASPAVGRRIAGIHVEGPFIAREDGPRGAHPVEHIRPPDWDEFQQMQEAAGGRIRIFTLSPEYEQAPAFIEKLSAIGTVVSLGHTAATTDQIRAAVDAGARMSTHLGNGAHALIPRHHNYLWDQLAEDRLSAGIICDGHHLPPSLVKTFVRAKTPDRCILVSDVSGLAGLPPGRYNSELCELEILASGKLVVAGQREVMAGASAPLGSGVANVMHFAGVSLEVAFQMAVHNPARLLGLTPGGFEPGDPADYVLFDLRKPAEDNQPADFKVRATVLDGEVVAGTV